MAKLTASRGPDIIAGDFSFDPRPDLAADSVLWSSLLMSARAIDGNNPDGLYGALDCVRGLGAQLKTIDGRLWLVAGEMTDDEYASMRQRWLVPHQETLVRLLGNIERWAKTDAARRPAVSATAAEVVRQLAL
jgi:hypothetical protein